MAHLLFVLHEASRTGAPFTQLHFMRWVKKHTSHTMSLLLIWGGELVPEFEELGDVYVVDHGKLAVSIKERVVAKWDRMTSFRKKGIFKAIAVKKPEVIFANSIVALSLSAEIKAWLNAPLILNAHELEHTFFYYSRDKFIENSRAVDLFVPGSYAVRSYLQSLNGAPDDKMQVVYDFIDDAVLGNTTEAEIRARHGIPAGAPVVGAIASLSSRKAPDLFLAVAQRVIREQPEAYFVWVGGKPEALLYKETMRDIRLMGLSERVLFVGDQKDLRGYYDMMDVFLLTSREDPFPLVCLEASLAGTPIICFDKAGGMPEFARNDAGFVVPYLDTDAMAEKTLALLRNPELAEAKGQLARQRVLDNHTIRTIGPALYEIVQRFLPQHGTA